MQKTIAITTGLLAIVVGMQAMSADEQSLGELARQQRQQQGKKAGQTKVVTNEDIPEHPDDSNDGQSTKPEQNEAKVAPDMSADRVKAVIRAQKARIASLQAQIDKLSGSVHYVEANRYRNGVEHNQIQQRKQQEVELMQKQLEGEKSKLEQMQEVARHAGFGSAVYDP